MTEITSVHVVTLNYGDHLSAFTLSEENYLRAVTLSDGDHLSACSHT